MNLILIRLTAFRLKIWNKFFCILMSFRVED